MAPFDLILHLFPLGPPVADLCAKCEVSSFNRSRDMEGVPKFTHSLTYTLTDRHVNGFYNLSNAADALGR